MRHSMASDATLAKALQEMEDRDLARHLEEMEGHGNAFGIDADEALARQLQEMEMNDTPKFSLSDDEAFARQLQEMEDDHLGETSNLDNYGDRSEIEYGVGDSSEVEATSRDHNTSETRLEDDIDPDNMTYEEMTELGESIGSVSKGLSEEQISGLPTHKYNAESLRRKRNSTDRDEECSICQTEYEKGEVVLTLPCAHHYHRKCISRWLEKNRNCCVCNLEVSP